jgi:hypothetical protein
VEAAPVIVHVRVRVPLATMPNRRLCQLLDRLYGDQVVHTREEDGRTTTWLRLHEPDDQAATICRVRDALAVSGVTDGVEVVPYRPRTDATSRARRTGTGSPWRRGQGVLPGRAHRSDPT